MNIIFFGSPTYSSKVLKYLIGSRHLVKAVITQDVKKSKKKRDLKTPVGLFSEKNNLLTLYPDNLEHYGFVDQLEKLKADVFLIYAYGKILPKELINIPKYGVINIHCSLLPKWRGAAPIQRALLNKDSITGVTFFKIDESLDTGNIISSHEYTIEEEEDSISLQDNLTDLAITNLEEAFQINSNNSIFREQDNAVATYAKKLSKAEALVSWGDDAETIILKLKAFAGWSGIEAELFGTKFKIIDAKYFSDNGSSKPGSIINFDHGKLEIAAKNGFIQIHKLQLPGKNIITCRDLFNSNSEFSGKIKNYCVK